MENPGCNKVFKSIAFTLMVPAVLLSVVARISACDKKWCKKLKKIDLVGGIGFLCALVSCVWFAWHTIECQSNFWLGVLTILVIIAVFILLVAVPPKKD